MRVKLRVKKTPRPKADRITPVMSAEKGKRKTKTKKEQKGKNPTSQAGPGIRRKRIIGCKLEYPSDRDKASGGGGLTIFLLF